MYFIFLFGYIKFSNHGFQLQAVTSLIIPDILTW